METKREKQQNQKMVLWKDQQNWSLAWQKGGGEREKNKQDKVACFHLSLTSIHHGTGSSSQNN